MLCSELVLSFACIFFCRITIHSTELAIEDPPTKSA